MRPRPSTAAHSARDFALFDNEVRRQIDTVAMEDLPVRMMLALDTSFSVGGELKNRGGPVRARRGDLR